MIVMKFGGTSLGDAEAMAQAIEVIRAQRDRQPLVVASAMSGVTDALSACAETAHQGHESEAVAALEELAERHRDAAGLIEDPDARNDVIVWLDGQFAEIRTLLKGLAILGERTPRSLDALLAYGERLASGILAVALRSRGLPAKWVDAREVVVTDERFGRASPILDKSRTRAQTALRAMSEEGWIPVTQGFVGATEEGVTTTLGRGGSDYSAAFLGALLHADTIEIHTDVQGVMTADPTVVPEARPVEHLSYNEAAELATFGARVIHPMTVAPAVEAAIPIRIRDTFRPDTPGTRIGPRATAPRRAVKAVTAVRGLSLITIGGRGMLGVPGVAARVFGAVAEQDVNVLMISQASSEQSICFAVESAAAETATRALEAAFEPERLRHSVDRIEAQDAMAVLAVVGAGMKGTPGIAAKVFGALGDRGINVVSIAQGSSEYNLSLAVAEDEVDAAMRAIHREFGLEEASS